MQRLKTHLTAQSDGSVHLAKDPAAQPEKFNCCHTRCCDVLEVFSLGPTSHCWPPIFPMNSHSVGGCKICQFEYSCVCLCVCQSVTVENKPQNVCYLLIPSLSPYRQF